MEEYQRKISLLRKQTGIREEDVTEYQKAEILRQSIADVKARAAVQADKRLSPRKYYGNVKSKVSTNLKSQKSAKKRAMKVAIEQAQQDEITGISQNRSPGRRTQTHEFIDASSGKKAQRSPVRASEMSPSRKVAARLEEIEKKQAEIDNLKAELANSAWKQRQTLTGSNRKSTVSETYSQNVVKSDARAYAQPEPVSVNISRGQVEEFKNEERARPAPLDDFEEDQNDQQFADLQQRDQPAPAARVPQSSAPVHENTVTVTEGSIYFEESRAAKIAAQTPVESATSPQPEPQVPAPEEEPVRVLVDDDVQELRSKPKVVKKTNRSPTKSYGGNTGGGPMYFEPSMYQATVDPNTQSVTVNEKSATKVKPYAYQGSKVTKKAQAQFCDSLYRGQSPSKQRMSGSQASTATFSTKKKGTKKSFGGAPPQREQTLRVEMEQPVYESESVNIEATPLNDSYAQEPQQQVEYRRAVTEVEARPQTQPLRTNTVQISSNGLPSDHKFRNRELEARTAEIQAEFDRILNS